LVFEVGMTRFRIIRLVAVVVVLICTVGCDQATKQLARTSLSQTGSVTFPGSCLQFTLAENPGAFLSLGASLPQGARSALAVCLAAGLAFLLVYLVRALSLRWLCFLGLALIWAGGVSNLVDRVFRHGLVTDFMILRVGPIHTGVFNVAVFAVLVGMGFLAATWRAGPHKGALNKSSARSVKARWMQ
jgi:signal peptidase II